MSLYNLPDHVPCKAQELILLKRNFLGGIYVYKKCLGTSRTLILLFLMVIPLCLNAPDFQLSIRNCRPASPWGWLSTLFYRISVFIEYFFPDLWFLLCWSPFMFSEYFAIFYVSWRKIWDHHFDSRLTKLVNIFITNRFDLYQDFFFYSANSSSSRGQFLFSKKFQHF